MEQLIETVDMTDWGEEILNAEPDMSGFDEAVREQMTNGRSPLQMGRFAVAGRLLGMADSELVPPTKLLVQTGAARCWTERLGREKEIVEMEDGRQIRVRSYIGPVAEQAGDDQARTEPWVTHDSPEATQRAERYLLNVVPGHIRARFNIIAANSGDVEAAAESLKRGIDAMVEALSE